MNEEVPHLRDKQTHKGSLRKGSQLLRFPNEGGNQVQERGRGFPAVRVCWGKKEPPRCLGREGKERACSKRAACHLH